MANNQMLRKRLIISGITPSITKDALSQRLASFGTVESIDGVGSLDGNGKQGFGLDPGKFDLLGHLGQPRKFAHLTLVTSQPKLSRCVPEYIVVHVRCPLI